MNSSGMPDRVRAKKSLGQHFLTDKVKAQKIVSLLVPSFKGQVLEIGPGMGILTEELLRIYGERLWVVEIDSESVRYIGQAYPALAGRIIHQDFLKMRLKDHFSEPVALIGNFPYNISSQILFRVLEQRDMVEEVVGMFQREVARRLVAPPGGREYGILSVLMDAWFIRDYHMTIDEHQFRPPPKVKSGVVSFRKKDDPPEIADEAFFIKVVKTAFNQRRKTLRNSLSVFGIPDADLSDWSSLRAEQLSFEDFIQITQRVMQG